MRRCTVLSPSPSASVGARAPLQYPTDMVKGDTMKAMTTTLCATEGCIEDKVGKSKYCRKHRAEARQAWKGMIAASAQEREARDAAWKALHVEAHAAGMAASEAHKPEPMGVTDGKQTWVIDGGVCGFAWVLIRPGNCSFAIWAKKNIGARAAYGGGVDIWCPLPTQSMTTKEAYCEAYVKVLRARGIAAIAKSRID